MLGGRNARVRVVVAVHGTRAAMYPDDTLKGTALRVPMMSSMPSLEKEPRDYAVQGLIPECLFRSTQDKARAVNSRHDK
jgi:hypothetical protein